MIPLCRWCRRPMKWITDQRWSCQLMSCPKFFHLVRVANSSRPMTDELRHALSDHDITAPLTPAEMLTLAGEMEEALIANECNFSHPDWRYVDGLRALAARAPAPG